MKMDLVDVLRQSFQYQISLLHTAMPGRIESYDFSQQKANVKPLLKTKYLDDKVFELPVIVNVPVIFPRSGTASLTFPVNEGDGVLLIFSERSLDRWLSVGGICEPTDNRKFDLSDAIAIPGLNSFNIASLAENNSDVRLTYGKSNIRMTPDYIHINYGSSDFIANDTSIKMTLGGGTLEIDQSGKLNLQSGGTDVLDVLSQALAALSSAQVFTGDAGNQGLNNAGTYGSLQAQIDGIRF